MDKSALRDGRTTAAAKMASARDRNPNKSTNRVLSAERRIASHARSNSLLSRRVRLPMHPFLKLHSALVRRTLARTTVQARSVGGGVAGVAADVVPQVHLKVNPVRKVLPRITARRHRKTLRPRTFKRAQRPVRDRSHQAGLLPLLLRTRAIHRLLSFCPVNRCASTGGWRKTNRLNLHRRRRRRLALLPHSNRQRWLRRRWSGTAAACCPANRYPVIARASLSPRLKWMRSRRGLSPMRRQRQRPSSVPLRRT